MAHGSIEHHQSEYYVPNDTDFRNELSTTFSRHPESFLQLIKSSSFLKKPVCVESDIFPECSSFTYKVWRCVLFLPFARKGPGELGGLLLRGRLPV